MVRIYLYIYLSIYLSICETALIQLSLCGLLQERLGLLVWVVALLKARYASQITGSTAQGGGGSFKNRKPIGEVGCCESGMAERIH